MSDNMEEDVADLPSAPTSGPRWTVTHSTSFFNAISATLTDSVVDSITESELRLAIIAHMQQHHGIAVDVRRIVTRLAEAKKCTDDFALQLQAFNDCHSKWEEGRNKFLNAQRERRQTRAERAARRRPPQQAIDSDDEFEESEPQLPQSALQKARVGAWTAYERVKGRFEADRRQQQAVQAEATRVAKKEQKRMERQRALLSTLNPGAGPGAGPEVGAEAGSSMDDSASSSSSSSPTKRKFQPAAVVGVYMEYCTQAVVSQAQLAADLREAMSRQEQATAAWRERKFKAESEYRMEKLRLLRGDKENRDPNTQ